MSIIRDWGTRGWCPLFLVLMAATGAVAETPIGTPYECGDIDQTEIRSQLLDITRRTFDHESRLAEHAVFGSVAIWWAQLGGDRVVAEAVESGRRQVLAELDLWETFQTGLDPDRANDVAIRLGTYAFAQPEFRAFLEQIAERAASDLTMALEAAAAAAASSMTQCISRYVSANWPESLAYLFQQHLATLGSTSWQVPGDQRLTVSDLAFAHHTAIAGMALIISSQVASRLLPIILSKAAAKVATAIVPVAGWILGGSLIVWDVVRMKEGAVPMAVRSLTSPSHLSEIRSGMSEQVLQEIRRVSPQVSLSVAEDWFQRYRSFLDQWKLVVSWSQNSEQFKRVVQLTGPDGLPRLADLLNTLSSVSSQKDIQDMIENGEFEVLLHLGESGRQVLGMTGDPQSTLRWGSLAGMYLDRVVDAHLPTLSKPSDFDSRDDLVDVLNLDLERSELRRLMALEAEERQFLATRDPEDARDLLSLTADDNAPWLLPLLTELAVEDANVLIRRILIAPTIVGKIQPDVLRRHIARNQEIESYIAQLDRASWLDRIADLAGGLSYGESTRPNLPLHQGTRGMVVAIVLLLALAWVRERRRRKR